MKGKDYKKLSKTISHALRHEPDLYGLTLDKNGWGDLPTLYSSLRNFPIWHELEMEDIQAMHESSPKARFEIDGQRIRALYGHSFDGPRIEKEPGSPPEFLYRGTSPERANDLLKEGLNSGNRHYVHLSVNPKDAFYMGYQKAHHPIILRIDAQKAHSDGIKFYPANDVIWLSDAIPSQYIGLDPGREKRS